MIKVRALLSVPVALAAMTVTPGPAMAQYHQGEDPLYYYYYFNSDYSEQVGYEYDTCNYWGVGKSALEGVRSANVSTERWAYCRNGQLSLE